jgi:hypothetical protein
VTSSYWRLCLHRKFGWVVTSVSKASQRQQKLLDGVVRIRRCVATNSVNVTRGGCGRGHI